MSTIAVTQLIKQLKNSVTAADIAAIAKIMNIEVTGNGSRQRIDAEGAKRITDLESERRPEEKLIETVQRTQRQQSDNRQVQNRVQSDVATEESQQGLDYFAQKVANDAEITGRQMAIAYGITSLQKYEEWIGKMMGDPEASSVIAEVADNSTRKFQNLFIREENGFRNFLLPTSVGAQSTNLLLPGSNED